MLFLQHILFVFSIIFVAERRVSTIKNEVIIRQSRADRVTDKIRKIEVDLEKDEEQIKIDYAKFRAQTQIANSIKNIDIIRLNVAGELIITTRRTLTQVQKSLLSIMFNGRWDHKLEIDQNENIYLDFNPNAFRYLLDQLQLFGTNNLKHISLPSDRSLVIPFQKMIHKLGLDLFLSPQKKNVITYNVDGQVMTTYHTIFNETSKFATDTIISSSKSPKYDNKSDLFVDYHPKLFQHLINKLREKSSNNNNKFSLEALSNKEKVYFRNMLIDLNISQIRVIPPITNNTQWKQHAITVAGGNGQGDKLNQLHWPHGLSIDNDQQSIYIADYDNYRIAEWKFNAKTVQVIAAGNGRGNQMNQLNRPSDVLVDTKYNSLIICDEENRRVVEWSRQSGTKYGQILISDIDCRGITMDKNGYLYVSDWKKNEVRRWKRGETTKGIVVAGGNGSGDRLNQLNSPTYLFVDQDDSLYVSDKDNHRVIKWMKNAKEGIIVAGGQGQGDQLIQLSYPQGVIVDHLGNVYVADSWNHRIMCWSKESKEGRIIVGGNGKGEQSNQLNNPRGISFDREDTLYTVDYGNHRVQKFEIDKY